MLRYFFPPAFRISKDDVNSMAAEELVAFPLVRQTNEEKIRVNLKFKSKSNLVFPSKAIHIKYALFSF